MDSWEAATRSMAMTKKRWGMPKPKVKKSRPVVNKMGECGGAAQRSMAMTEKRWWEMPKPKVKKSRPMVNKMGARRHCQATKNTGLPCTAAVKHGNNFCGTHQPKVPKAGPICQATIASSGEPCPAQSKWGSRWCGKHFAKWHASP